MSSLRLSFIVGMLLLASSLQSAPITQGVPGAVPVDEFRVMTESEIAEHTKMMQSLNGTNREDYRNSEYQKLKQRALAQGFRLPDTPPWGRTVVVPAAISPAEATEQDTPETPPTQQATSQASPPMDMAAMIQQQQTVVEQAIKQHQNTVQEQQEATAKAVTQAAKNAQTQHTLNIETQAKAHNDAIAKKLSNYRQVMRERFDQFMAEREARQAEAMELQKEAEARMEQQRQQQLATQQRYQQRYPRPQYQYPRPPQAQMRPPVAPAYPTRIYPRPPQGYRPYPPQAWPQRR